MEHCGGRLLGNARIRSTHGELAQLVIRLTFLALAASIGSGVGAAAPADAAVKSCSVYVQADVGVG
jgi:hypothetical protein